MFLVQALDELTACCTAAGHSYWNPVERVHAITNLGLHSVGMMRQKMSTEMHRLMKNVNTNQELRKATERHDGLKKALDEGHSILFCLLKFAFNQPSSIL